MPLVPAICTNCGGELRVDSSKDAAVCPHCGTPYVVEKAIHYYTTRQETHIEHADIHMEDSSGLEARLANAESYLVQHRKYEKAETLFKAITEEHAGDWRGWWGVARAMTHEFTGLPVALRFGEHCACSIAYSDVTATPDRIREEAVKMGEESLTCAGTYATGAFNVMEAERLAQARQEWEQFEQRARRRIAQLADKTAEAFAENKQLFDRRTQLHQEQTRVQDETRKYKTRQQLAANNSPFTVLFGTLAAAVCGFWLSGALHIGFLRLLGAVFLAVWVCFVCLRVYAVVCGREAAGLQEQGERLGAQYEQLGSEMKGSLEQFTYDECSFCSLDGQA